jgi:hypothetical protein
MSCVLVALGHVPVRAQTQKVERIAQIKKSAVGKKIQIAGIAGTIKELPDSQFFSYTLEDRFGQTIQVVSNYDKKAYLPRITYLLEARVRWSKRARKAYLEEVAGTRRQLGVWVKDNGGQKSPGVSPDPLPPEKSDSTNWVLVVLTIGTGLVLLALVAVLVQNVRGNGQKQDWVPIEGKTIKLQGGSDTAVAQGTVKLLPGRFEVLDGESDLKDIRLFLAPDNQKQEFTIGRAGADGQQPPNHIGFKTNTVSGDQGKLVYSSGKYIVTNHVDQTKNPIMINGTALTQGAQQTLSDKDEIQIGVVRLKYHAA